MGGDGTSLRGPLDATAMSRDETSRDATSADLTRKGTTTLGGDSTTLISNVEEAFALEPLDVNTLQGRGKCMRPCVRPCVRVCVCLWRGVRRGIDMFRL